MSDEAKIGAEEPAIPGSIPSEARGCVGHSSRRFQARGHTRSLQRICVGCRVAQSAERTPSSSNTVWACSRESHARGRTLTAGQDRRFASRRGQTSGRSVAKKRSRSGRNQAVMCAATNPVPDPSSMAVIECRSFWSSSSPVNGAGSNSHADADGGWR